LSKGTSPYNFKYQVRHKPEHGSSSIQNKEFEAALGLATISMETSKAGTYEYEFSELPMACTITKPKSSFPLYCRRSQSKAFSTLRQTWTIVQILQRRTSWRRSYPHQAGGCSSIQPRNDIKHQSSLGRNCQGCKIETNHYDFRIHTEFFLSVYTKSA